MIDSAIKHSDARVSRGRETLRKMTGLFPGRHSRRAGTAANLAQLLRAVPDLAMNASA